jgi:hypothetical protein
MTVPTLIITGPVGVGKTSVVGEISHVLAERGLSHATGDMDNFSEFFPHPPGDPFGIAISLQNLAAVWRNYRAAGAERLILAGVMLGADDINGVCGAVPGADITLCRLRADVTILKDRVRRRELGAGLEWHVERAAVLAQHFESLSLPHFVVDTQNRTVRAIAQGILVHLDWIIG